MYSKKFLSACLAAMMALPSAAVFAADSTGAFPDVKADSAYRNAVLRLNALGIISGDDKGNYNPDATLTRAEAAKILVTALGQGKVKGATTAKFTDVKSSDWFATNVGVASSIGLIKGYTKDGKSIFAPNDKVTYGQYATMAVRALGYSEEDLQGDTWPYNYIAKATELGLLDKVDEVDADASVKRSDVALMSDAMMFANVKGGGVYAGQVTNRKLLDTVAAKLGVMQQNAVVLATNNENADVPADKVECSSLDNHGNLSTYTYYVDAASSNLKDYVGKEVTLYISRTTSNKVLFADTQDATADYDLNAYTVVKEGNLKDGKVDGKTISTSDTTDYTVSASAPIYVNGVKYKGTFAQLSAAYNDCQVKLISFAVDKNATAGVTYYDLVYVTKAGNAGTYVVDSVDATNKMIKTVDGKVIPYITAAKFSGDATKFEDLKKYDVVSLTEDLTDPTSSIPKTMAVNVTRKTVVGKVTQAAVDNSSITVGTTKYDVADAGKAKIGSIKNDAFAKDYTFILDKDGKVLSVYDQAVTVTAKDMAQYAVWQGVYTTTTDVLGRPLSTPVNTHYFINGLGKTVSYNGSSAALKYYSDAIGDSKGTGDFSSTTDIQNIVATKTDADLTLTFGMGAISTAWGPSNGFDHVAFAITLGDKNSTLTDLPFLNATAGNKFTYEAIVGGWNKDLFKGGTKDAFGTTTANTIGTAVDTNAKTVTIVIPKSSVSDLDWASLTVAAATHDWDGMQAGTNKFRSSLGTSPLDQAAVTFGGVSNVTSGSMGKLILDSNNNVIGLQPVDNGSNGYNAKLIADDATILVSRASGVPGTVAFDTYTGTQFNAAWTPNLGVTPLFVVGDTNTATGFAPVKFALFDNINNTNLTHNANTSAVTANSYAVVINKTTAIVTGADLYKTSLFVNGVKTDLVFGKDAWAAINGASGNTVVLKDMVKDSTGNVTNVSVVTPGTATNIVGITSGLIQLTGGSSTAFASDARVYVYNTSNEPEVKTIADLKPGMQASLITDGAGNVVTVLAQKMVNVTFKVVVPDGKTFSDGFLYVTGPFAGWNASDSYKLTQIPGTQTYTGTFSLPVGTDYKFRDKAGSYEAGDYAGMTNRKLNVDADTTLILQAQW